jgi:hypothetical protein
MDFLPGRLVSTQRLDKQKIIVSAKGPEFPQVKTPINHNSSVYGWTLRNTMSRTADDCLAVLNRGNNQRMIFLKQVPENHNAERSSLMVLNTARDVAKALYNLQGRVN